MPSPPLFRFRDLAFGFLFLSYTLSFAAFPYTSVEGVAFRVVYFWLLFLAVRGWWRYRRRVGPEVRQFHQTQNRRRISQGLRVALTPHFTADYSLAPLDEGGVQLTAPTGTIYHIYGLGPQDIVVGSDAGSARQRANQARSQQATTIYLDQQGGPAVVQGYEVWIRTGPAGLAEQVVFWEAPRAQEQAARQRGVEVEAQALGHLKTAFSGWRIQMGLLMRHGGDVDALLTRPDGRVISVDVKSHRGTPNLVDGVLYLSRTEKSGVQRQLHLQAQETGGQGVCWQPEANYGVMELDGLLFVGGDVWQLREALTSVR
jgi:hypothetical protein